MRSYIERHPHSKEAVAHAEALATAELDRARKLEERLAKKLARREPFPVEYFEVDSRLPAGVRVVDPRGSIEQVLVKHGTNYRCRTEGRWMWAGQVAFLLRQKSNKQ